jgi:hypothetical protein
MATLASPPSVWDELPMRTAPTERATARLHDLTSELTMFETAFSASTKPAAVVLGGLLCLIACESTEDATDGDGSALEEQLAECPVLSLSSDPSAGSCLAGTYEGKTPSGEACSLELGEGGTFEFTSPSLVGLHTAPDNTSFIFDHTVIGDFEQIVWKVFDPTSVETWYELDFQARFGAGVPEADSKIQIEVSEHGESSTKSVVCVVEL